MGKKCDIVLDRSMTINMGNFSSIKPGITVTLKDVDETDFLAEYNRLSDLADAIMALELLKIGDEAKTILNQGINVYIKELEKHREEMLAEITKFSTRGILDG